MLPSGLPDQTRHLEEALAAGRLTIAEVALGAAPLVTSLRTMHAEPG